MQVGDTVMLSLPCLARPFGLPEEKEMHSEEGRGAPRMQEGAVLGFQGMTPALEVPWLQTAMGKGLCLLPALRCVCPSPDQEHLAQGLSARSCPGFSFLGSVFALHKHKPTSQCWERAIRSQVCAQGPASADISVATAQDRLGGFLGENTAPSPQLGDEHCPSCSCCGGR